MFLMKSVKGGRKKPASSYDASAIEILSGLDPVRRRPGMYVDTANPNHLAHEVIDNSVDEALAGYASEIAVTVHEDYSMSVADNGRGMPIDQHAERQISAAEVILTTLHAGGKFSHNHYRYAGGLHGVGVSVVNALSKRLTLEIDRSGKTYAMEFAGGEPRCPLKLSAGKSKRRHGTTIRFWPDASYFDSIEFNRKKLLRLLQAKAVLCSGLRIIWRDQPQQQEHVWCYQDGFHQYFQSSYAAQDLLLSQDFAGSHEGEHRELKWILNWGTDDAAFAGESYVN